MKQILSFAFIFICLVCVAFGQAEILTNSEIVSMTKAGLSKELIASKIAGSNGRFDTTTQALIDLKKSGVADETIALMLEKTPFDSPQSKDSNAQTAITLPVIQPGTTSENSKSHITLDSKEALHSAKTIAIEKSSLNPSRQALEKELLKRKDWQHLNLNIVRYKTDADLYVEIGFVPFSVITHRYVFRVYDRKSGTVIAAGETTSWGSLAENLARRISKELVKAL